MLFRLIKKTPNINFTEKRKIFFFLSIFLALVSLFSLWIKGLNFGIDFKGGLLVEAKFDKNIELENLRKNIDKLELGDFSIQGLDNSSDNFLIKIELSQEFKVDQAKLISELKKSIDKNFDSNVDYRRVEYVGPTVSSELIMTGIIAILLVLISYFSLGEYKKKQKIEISDTYNSIIIDYSKNNKEKTAQNLIELINKKDPTYSPLSLYFLIDNNLINEKKKINDLFNVVIEEISLDKEIKNLNIYKKALYNADNSDENDLLKILNPIIKSESVWKSHALYLMAEYFYSKNEMQKSKEFFSQIINLKNVNDEIKLEAQKRLYRDLSE